MVTDNHQVFDAHPELTRQVHAGLDGDHVPGFEHRLGALPQPRLLVDLQPDAVTEPVSEVWTMPRGVADLARDGVDLAAGLARSHGLEARQLCLEDKLVDLGAVPAGAARRDRSRAVRAVAVERRSEVDRDELPSLDLDVARLGVWERAVRAARSAITRDDKRFPAGRCQGAVR